MGIIPELLWSPALKAITGFVRKWVRKKLIRKSSVMKMYYLINSKGICTGKNSTLARIFGILRISRTQEGRN